MSRLKILVAPLDWGLGHATRCVPIIESLLDKNLQVLIATNGSAKDYLSQRFPELKILEPPAYKITYSGGQAFFDILLQTPKILKTVAAEHSWLHEAIKIHGIHGIISDNRYGMYGDVPSVIVTHQTTPKGPPLFRQKLQRMVTAHTSNFGSCWIPDSPDRMLAGELSGTEDLKIPHAFVGPLSRLKRPETTDGNHLVGLVSGPETQRTEFENELMEFLQSTWRDATLICGKPGDNFDSIENSVRRVNHLDDNDLADALCNAQYIFCRSGYSTIMDLASLGLRANLIPTKGQSEQVYLAKHLSQKYGWGYFRNVASISLKDCINSQGASVIGAEPKLLSEEIERFVHLIRSEG